MARRSPVTSGERRRQIVATAREQFVANGFERSSMLGIAERLDIDRITVYRQFPDLVSVYAAVLDDAAVKLSEALDGAADAATTAPVGSGARAEAFLYALVRSARSDPVTWHLLDDSPRDPEAAAIHDALRARVADGVTEALIARAGVVLPALSRTEITIGSEFLYAGVLAALRHQVNARPRRGDRAFARFLAQAIVRFLATATPEPAPTTGDADR
jgi:AcrR family transcriptional regulator